MDAAARAPRASVRPAVECSTPARADRRASRRPADYAATFARQIITLSALELPITVCAVSRPDWLEAVLEQTDVQTSSLDAAMQLYGKTKE